jgi:hypothetical protein
MRAGNVIYTTNLLRSQLDFSQISITVELIISPKFARIYLPQKGYKMSSFLENENQMVIDAIYSDIADHLVQEWINNNLDEGQLYADYQFASMSDSNYIKGRFNQFYNLTAADQYYLEWDEEK